jgi:hypothetical protein
LPLCLPDKESVLILRRYIHKPYLSTKRVRNARGPGVEIFIKSILRHILKEKNIK